MKPRTTDDIRNWACGGRDWLEDQFDRWLSELIRKEREGAWNEAVDNLSAHWFDVAPKAVEDLEARNPYRKE